MTTAYQARAECPYPSREACLKALKVTAARIQDREDRGDDERGAA